MSGLQDKTTISTLTAGQGMAGAFARIRALFSRRGLYVLGDQVVYSFGNMVVAALLSRHCTALEFGVYILTQRAMDVLIQLSNVFIWSPLVYRLPSMPEPEQRPYRGSIVILQIAFCVFFSLLLSVLAVVTRSATHVELPATFSPLASAAGILLFREFVRRFLFAHMRFREAFWTDIVTVGAQIAGIELLRRAGALAVSSALPVLAAGSFLIIPWWIVRDRTLWKLNGRAVLPDLARDFQMGRWFFGSNLVFLVSAQCNPWLLSSLLGGSAVGSYAICESLVNIPRAALASAENSLGPKLARAHSEGGKPSVRVQVKRLEKRLVLGAAGCTFALWSLGPNLAVAIFGKVPSTLRPVTLLLAVNLVVYASTLAESFGLASMGRPQISVVANALGLLCQLVFSVQLVRSLGLLGAAAALLTGTVVSALVRRAWYERETSSIDQTVPGMCDTLLQES